MLSNFRKLVDALEPNESVKTMFTMLENQYSSFTPRDLFYQITSINSEQILELMFYNNYSIVDIVISKYSVVYCTGRIKDISSTVLSINRGTIGKTETIKDDVICLEIIFCFADSGFKYSTSLDNHSKLHSIQCDILSMIDKGEQK